jgi:hypothetical protein
MEERLGKKIGKRLANLSRTEWLHAIRAEAKAVATAGAAAGTRGTQKHLH